MCSHFALGEKTVTARILRIAFFSSKSARVFLIFQTGCCRVQITSGAMIAVNDGDQQNGEYSDLMVKSCCSAVKVGVFRGTDLIYHPDPISPEAPG